MWRQRRVGLVVALGAVLLAAFAADLLHQVWLRRAIESSIRWGLLTVSVRDSGGYSEGDRTLRLDAAGNATWQNEGSPRRSRRLKVTKTQLDELRKALLRERFFELAGSYGEDVADGGTTTLKVTAGNFTKTVELQFLGNWFFYQPEKYREPSRAVHILDVIHGWFGEERPMGAGRPP